MYGDMVSNFVTVGSKSKDRLDDALTERVVDLGLYELEDNGAMGVVVDNRSFEGLLDLFGLTV